MYFRRFAGAAVLLGLLSPWAIRADADHRLPLRPDMLLNETAVGGDPAGLVDEQGAIGDPGVGKGLRPVKPYFSGWGAENYPVQILIDMGAPTRVTRVFLYNESGDNALTLSTGKPFAWKDQPITLGGYRNWREFPLGATTRYLRLTIPHPTKLSEIAVYGDSAPAVPAKTQARAGTTRQPRARPTMDAFIGTNAFIDDPLDKLAVPVGFVREYHNWSWDTEGADHFVRFQPSGAAGGNAWFFDDFYAGLKARGVTVSPAIQQTSLAYFPGVDGDSKPVAAGADAEQPASYARHAAHLFQFAARYGGVRAPDAALTLAPGQPRRSGLGSLRYIEDWNEPDKTWRGRAGRFTPYELAAMCSADFDGDQGRLGKAVGVRAADPQMSLVMGGLAGLHLDYLRAMKLWADYHRGGDFPASVINLHHYSSDGNDDQGFKTAGISPEADRLREKLAAIVAWRDANVPGREVWLTEFGYDTDPKSPLHAPAVGAYSAPEIQAIWLVRSYLALAAAGVDRAAQFMFRDVKPGDGGVFTTCGMVTEKGRWEPKPSYWYIATLKTRLSGMRYAGELPSGHPDVSVYRFVGTSGATAFVVWCPTSDDRRVPGVTLPVGQETATRIDFAVGQPSGVSAPLVTRGGHVTIDAREQPMIVLIRSRHP